MAASSGGGSSESTVVDQISQSLQSIPISFNQCSSPPHHIISNLDLCGKPKGMVERIKWFGVKFWQELLSKLSKHLLSMTIKNTKLMPQVISALDANVKSGLQRNLNLPNKIHKWAD